MADEQLQSLLDILNELLEDTTVPKNVKSKVEEIIKILNSEDELSIKVSKALNELEEVSDDANLQPYTRTQVWNIISILESLI